MDEKISSDQFENDIKTAVAQKYFKGNVEFMKLFVKCMEHENLTNGNDPKVKAECSKMDLIGTATMRTMQDLGGNNAKAFLFLFSALVAYLYEMENYEPKDYKQPIQPSLN